MITALRAASRGSKSSWTFDSSDDLRMDGHDERWKGSSPDLSAPNPTHTTSLPASRRTALPVTNLSLRVVGRKALRRCHELVRPLFAISERRRCCEEDSEPGECSCEHLLSSGLHVGTSQTDCMSYVTIITFPRLLCSPSKVSYDTASNSRGENLSSSGGETTTHGQVEVFTGCGPRTKASGATDHSSTICLATRPA